MCEGGVLCVDSSELGGGLSLEVDGWGDVGVESCCLIVHEVPELEADGVGQFFSLSGRIVWNIELKSACSYPAAPGGAT